ncbi:hypothetical protein IID24_05010, partial [Patescibacteria group bacterium]|nr:hypothetical protein [Patescibacteria group bacterium]
MAAEKLTIRFMRQICFLDHAIMKWQSPTNQIPAEVLNILMPEEFDISMAKIMKPDGLYKHIIKVLKELANFRV